MQAQAVADSRGGGRPFPPLLTEGIVKRSKNFAPKCIISA